MDEQMYFSESEGTALLLNCEADGYPQPSYKWEKNGRSFVLGENMSLNNGTLVISGPTASGGGAYGCFATNMFGTSVSARFHLMVHFLGRFPNIPRAEMTAVVGEHLTLECLHPSYSSEYIQMDWEYNDKSSTAFAPFVPNTHIVQDARGIDGSAGKLPNLIYSSANHVTAVAGHPLTMYCVYGGRPLPSQSWTTSVVTRSTVDNMVDTEFYIASVGTEDTGTYNCSATNQRGTRQTNYEVTVEEKAIFTSKIEDQRLMELSGGVASFKCLTYGNPSPKIDWIINGQQWHNATSAAAVREARVEIHQGTLVMSGAGPGDQMVVGCMAFNRYGSVCQEARLI